MIRRVPTPIWLILFAGAFLRLYALGAQSVWLDESVSGIAARGFLRSGYPMLPSGNPYDSYILHTGLVAVSFGVLGQTTAAGRLPAVILGTLSVLVAYLLGRRIKNGRTGILLAFFIAFSTVQISWSRQIRMYQQLQFFFLLSLYAFERFLDETSWKNLPLLLVSLICLPLSHGSLGYLLIVPFLLWLPIEKFSWLWEGAGKIGNFDRRDLIGLIVLIAVLAVLAWNWLPVLTSHVNRALGTEVNYFSNYIEYLDEKLGGLFYLGILGASLSVLRRKRNALYAVSFLLAFYVASRHILAFHHRYIFAVLPVLYLFSASALDRIYEGLKRLGSGWTSRYRLPAIGAAVALALAVMSASFTFVPESHYDLTYTAPQGEFNSAYEYVEENWRENDRIVSTLTPVTWYYLERSDYWISFSYWGRGNFPEEDHYTGAETILTVEDIEEATEGTHGWVVIEKMGDGRMKQAVLDYIRENFETIEEISGGGRGVWVYRWGS